MDLSEQPSSGAAQRRRQRRLLSWLRHERMTVAMALAEKLHHSSRGQKMARAGEGDLEMHYTGTFRTHPPLQAAGTLYYPMDVDDVPAAGGSRPDRLTEVRPQERVQRRTVEQIILAPMLDVPVPLMEEQLLVDAFALHDVRVPEQVIEVPKILIDELPARTSVRVPQLAEQLVEVPTIISFSSLQRTVEQNVDIPVPGRGGRIAGLQGFLPGQGSTALLFLKNVLLSGLWSRSLIFPVEAFKIFFQDKVHPLLLTIQLVLMMLWMRLVIGFFALFPGGKKCEDGSALGVGPECGLHLIHAVRL